MFSGHLYDRAIVPLGFWAAGPGTRPAPLLDSLGGFGRRGDGEGGIPVRELGNLDIIEDPLLHPGEVFFQPGVWELRLRPGHWADRCCGCRCLDLGRRFLLWGRGKALLTNGRLAN